MNVNCKFLEAALIAHVVPLATLRVFHYSRVRTLSRMNDIECAICFVLIDKLDCWWKPLRIDRISLRAGIEAAELILCIKRRVVLSKVFVNISLREGNDLIVTLQGNAYARRVDYGPAIVGYYGRKKQPGTLYFWILKGDGFISSFGAFLPREASSFDPYDTTFGVSATGKVES